MNDGQPSDIDHEHLDTIIEYKRTELVEQKAAVATATLEKSVFFSRKTLSLKAPSPIRTLRGYRGVQKTVPFEGGDQRQGVGDGGDPGLHGRGRSLSVSADGPAFFWRQRCRPGGARVNEIPILRKEFIIDEYQILEAGLSAPMLFC